jgi:hypothetical protein
MTRDEKIKFGLIHQVYPDSDPEKIMFEGSETACRGYVKAKRLTREVKTGIVRIGQVIWEKL